MECDLHWSWSLSTRIAMNCLNSISKSPFWARLNSSLWITIISYVSSSHLTNGCHTGITTWSPSIAKYINWNNLNYRNTGVEWCLSFLVIRCLRGFQNNDLSLFWTYWVPWWWSIDYSKNPIDDNLNRNFCANLHYYLLMNNHCLFHLVSESFFQTFQRPSISRFYQNIRYFSCSRCLFGPCFHRFERS